MREALQDTRGIRIHGQKIDMIRFADNIALTEDLAEALTTMKEVLSIYNMKINTNKTKIMVITKEETQAVANVNIDGVAINNVKCFPYLGSKIKQEGKTSQEIGSRIYLAKLAFNKKSKIFESALYSAPRDE